MVTKLLYLNGFDIVTCDAEVRGVQQMEDGRTGIQLDQTCFYPRGGGQDWDVGVIASSDGSVSFAVDEVRLDEHGVVHHLGSFRAGDLAVGDKVRCDVDTARRTVNTRLHSAGHVVDMAVDRLKLPWTPQKGGHYPHLSFVEYKQEGETTPEELEQIREQIERIAREAVGRGSKNEIRFMSVSEMHTVCRHVPANIPTNKPARVVIYNGDFGVPCGGTHVANINEIGKLTIVKIKAKKGVVKVSYAVEGIN